MREQTTNDSPISQSRRSGIVIATIGLHLLLCSIATAANAAGDSIDRSARRLPAQVAQALRDIVDRSASPQHASTRDQLPGFTLCDTPPTLYATIPDVTAKSARDEWARRLLNLPPPAAS
ncbi:MAG: hypothetical protein ACX94C_06040 [Phycisphaerales bacterium]